jgi:HTH-type transcriptional regulator/antitoxin HigA
MRPRIIKTEQEYDAALAHVDSLMTARAGTHAMEQLELWTLLVKTYEDEHYPIERPDPVEAIRYWMDQLGLTQSDLVPFIGAKSKVSEVLSGRRPLSKAMIRKLHEGLGIPAEILIGESGAGAKHGPMAS